MSIARPAGRYAGRYDQVSNGGAAAPARRRRQRPNGEAPVSRWRQRSWIPSRAPGSARASVSSRTQISSSIALRKKKRRLAVPCPVCTFRDPSVSPKRTSRSASGAPGLTQTST